MTYSAVYCALISKRLQNPLPKCAYGEVHHIIPKSEDGTNDKDNLVRLSAREHYVAHLLLAKIYNDVKMYSAITYFRTGRLDGRKFNVNSRLYKIIREQFGRLSSEAQRGCNSKWYGRHHTEETKKKISESNIGRVFSQQHRHNISIAMTGKKQSREAVAKRSKSVFQYSTSGELICEWDSMRDVERHLGISHINISRCCSGKYKTAGGFIWRFKN